MLDKKKCMVSTLLYVVVLILCCYAILFKSCAFFCIAIGVLLINFDKSNIVNNFFAIAGLVFIIYTTYLNIYSFVFLPQAYDLLEVNKDIIFWIKQGHIHAIRLVIVYPSYLMHLIFNIDLNLAFGYYCSIIFSLLYRKIMLIAYLFICRENIVYNFTVLSFIFILAKVMNGRICFAFLGFAILIYEMTLLYASENKPSWVKRYIKIIIGLILSTVSSGTMMVCICFLLLGFVMRIVRYKKIHKGAIRLVCICIIGIPIIHVAIQYVISMINKNITYFGGIFNMLQHGIGKAFGNMFEDISILVYLLGILMLFVNISILMYIYYRYCELMLLVIGINISFYGLFVGISTGTLILIPSIILILIIIDHVYYTRKAMSV